MRYTLPLFLCASISAVEIPDEWQLKFNDVNFTSITSAMTPEEIKKLDHSLGRIEKEEIVWKHKYHKIDTFDVDKKGTATLKFQDGERKFVLVMKRNENTVAVRYDESWEIDAGNGHTYQGGQSGAFTCRGK